MKFEELIKNLLFPFLPALHNKVKKISNQLSELEDKIKILLTLEAENHPTQLD